MTHCRLVARGLKTINLEIRNKVNNWNRSHVVLKFRFNIHMADG